ncbi:DUF1648 domain-containing protein [Trueperella pyogenes]|uniref:DUF1648 domain-containing protein n=1 Tax=Trueperella pyogenes TaxID=1661 RepID=UPI00325239D7
MGISGAVKKAPAQFSNAAIAIGSFLASSAFVGLPAAYVWINRASFPAKVPTHWGLDGSANNWSSLSSALTIDILLVVCTAALFLGVGYAARMLESFAPLAVGLSAFFATLTIGSIFAVAQEMTVIGPVLLAAVLAGGTVGWLTRRLLRRRISARPEESATFTPIEADGETNCEWHGRIRVSRGLDFMAVVVCIAAVVVGILLGRSDPFGGIAVGLILVGFGVMLASYRQRVHITTDAVTCTFLGIRTHEFPLEQILSAGCIDINAMAEFGGVGYRISILTRREGIVVGSGPSLIFQRNRQRDFVLCVDDSCAAARVLAHNLRRVEPVLC